MSSSKIPKAPYPEHPNRCQANIGANGQCRNLSAEGATTCLAHGGNSASRVEAKRSKHRYNIAKWRDKISRHSEDDDIKNLSAEVGVMRMLLETLMSQCENDVDLVTNSPMISDMLMKVDKLVNSLHRLDDKMGNLLDKSAIIAFAATVVEIISEEIEDAKVVAKIADRITGALAKGKNDDL